MMSGSKKRVLGVTSRNYLTAVSEVLYKLSQLKKFQPGLGGDDIVAHIHFKMSFRASTRFEYNEIDDFYAWDYDKTVEAPVRVQTIDYVIKDKKKIYFVVLDNGNVKKDSTPSVYREFAGNEKKEYLNMDLKAVPSDWKFQLKKAIEVSENDGLYLPTYDGPIKQEVTDLNTLPENVTPLFKK
jgi:hypothetical protein